MLVLVARERRASLLTIRERRQRLLVCEGFRDRAAARLELLVRQDRRCVSFAISLDTLGGIALRGRDPRVSGQCSTSH